MSTAAALKMVPGGREPARDAEAELALDTWHAERLGIVRRRSPTKIHFGPVSQPWLRETVKRWARFRLGTGASFGTLCSEVQGMGWFSRFLTEQHSEVGGGAGLTRGLLEHYLSWLASATLGESTRRTYLGFLHNFLESCRRHGWLAGLPADANIYFDELLRRPRPAPRFIDEFVMAQLEDPVNLAKLPEPTTRHLVELLIETGLRSGDALSLPFNPMLSDGAGWPCLRYFNAKIAEDQLVPLSPAGAETIRAQQAHLRDRSPDRDPLWLFPRPRGDPAEVGPFSYHTFRTRFTAWQHTIGLRDEAGAPVHVTAHQFRHTLGTRMINDGVPQHVIQRLLGHTTAQMTARYAHIHGTTPWCCSPPPSRPARPASPTPTGRSPPPSDTSSTRSRPSSRSPRPMPADNRAALTAATQQRADTTRARARAALRHLDHDGAPITVTTVATAAQV
jgi:integrase